MTRRSAPSGLPAVTTGVPTITEKPVFGARRGSGAEKKAKNVSTGTPILKKPARRKYHNVKVEIDGLTFDSQAEARRYGELRLLERDGEIRELGHHARFPLVVHGQDCGYYEADFVYITREGERTVEDVKSPATRKLAVYRLKAKLVWAIYGLTVREVMA